MMFMHYYINVLDNLNAFNNNIYYTISSANKKKVHQHWIELDGRDKLQRCESKKTQLLKWANFGYIKLESQADGGLYVSRGKKSKCVFHPPHALLLTSLPKHPLFFLHP